jgi:hypothetical protein
MSATKQLVNWKFTLLNTGDTIYAATRREGRDLARWYRTHTDPAVRTSTVVRNL